MYYKSQLEIKPTKIGKGLFCKVDIPAKVPIFEIEGNILDHNTEEIRNYDIQISMDNFIRSATGDFINHSCDPNVSLYVVGKRAFFNSIYLIKAGTELLYDYSTSSTDTLETWNMNCLCSSAKCRKVISGYQYLPDELKADYEKRNITALFIKMNIFQEEKI